MKLGVLLDHWKPAGGGAEVHTHKLVRRAQAAGDTVVVATMSGEVGEGVTTIRIPVPRTRPARDRAFAAAGVDALRSRGVDSVLAFRHAPDCDVYLPHGGFILDALAARDRARGRSRLSSTLRHALSPRVAYFAEAERAALGGSDGPLVICLSRRLQARLGALYPSATARSVVVPNGVDAAHFDPLPHREAGQALRRRHGLDGAYVGLLLAHHPVLKGARTAIEAMALEPAAAGVPPFHLVVGGGRLDARTRRLARRRDVADRVHEVGRLDDPRPWLAAADVFVHATYYDPCSLACLEALAMEVPVITTPENGASELMGGRGGIVLEAAGAPDALRVALGVLADPALRGVTGDDARYGMLRNREADRLDEILELCRTRGG